MSPNINTLVKNDLVIVNVLNDGDYKGMAGLDFPFKARATIQKSADDGFIGGMCMVNKEDLYAHGYVAHADDQDASGNDGDCDADPYDLAYFFSGNNECEILEVL